MDEKFLIGSYSASEEIQDESAELVFEGYKNGFDLTRLISHRFSLENAAEAIHVASNPGPGSMKIFIEPGATQV
jgi:L-iditol 2-dehydrogenase